MRKKPESESQPANHTPSQPGATSQKRPKKAAWGGPRLSEVIALAGILIVGGSLAYSSAEKWDRSTSEEELLRAASTLYMALDEYNIRYDRYPASGDPAEESLDRSTLQPLQREGVLPSPHVVLAQLSEGEVSVYCTPDLPTANHDYWAVLVSRSDPQVKVLLADTDEYPGREGEPMRGVYLLRGGSWKRWEG
jgi:hypothetical protein